MQIFKPMSLEEAKLLYSKMKEESQDKPISLLKICMEDIYFFTDGLTQNYVGTIKKEG